jgi:hypothetical protein
LKRRVLLDECVDVRLSSELGNHDVRTVVQQGWRGKKNGELLRLAAAHFDVFITIDKNLPFQQTISQLRLGVICLTLPGDEFDDIRALTPRLRHAVMKIKPGQVMRLEV